jgi:cysteine synthase A
LDEGLVDGVVLVSEADAVKTCRALAKQGFMFGGSTGTVITGALQWLDEHEAASPCVAIAPDRGELYLESVYQDRWVTEHFETGVYEGCEPRAAPQLRG